MGDPKIRPLRILHLIASFSVGGAERMLLGLAKQIHKADFPSHIYVFTDNDEVGSLLPHFQALDLPFQYVRSKRFYDPRVTRAIASYARQHQIDLIHTHLADADIVGRIVGRWLRIPVISTLQNSTQAYEDTYFHRRWSARFTARYLATHLVAVSEQIRQLFMAEWHIPAEQISTIYNAVNMKPFLSISEGTNRGGPFVITNIGSLTPQKAQDVLLDAAKLVMARHHQTQLLIVGQGELAQELAAKAKILGISDRVEFTGLRRDVPQILARSDIFVLSSLWEGMPLAAIEAMAAARPTILTDVGGNRELVETGVTGVIVPPDDPAGMADALLTLMGDAPQRVLLGHAARQKVRERFAITRAARDYEELYLKVWMKYYE